MLKWLGSLRDSNEREIKKLQERVEEINDLEPEFHKLGNDELKAKTVEFKQRVLEGTEAERQEIDKRRTEFSEAQKCSLEVEDFDQREQYSQQCKDLQNELQDLDRELRQQENRVLDDLLPEAFAAIREAASRTLGQRHFDVQLMGGMVLHDGKIAEMKTGEGKTLVATLPLYLNSLTGRGVHLVTVNDYLARRDPYWMGQIFHALGVTVASIFPMQTPDNPLPALVYDPDYTSVRENDPWRHFKPVKRAEAYRADITYGTSAEFGFDYLRDNMALDIGQYVQRDLNYAIVDEADDLLIDEARTPLIISAPDTESSQKYQVFARLVQSIKAPQDYEIKEKERSAEPTDEGFNHIEGLLKREGLLQGEGLYDPNNADLMRHLRNALTAKEFYKRDREYVVKDGEIIIVDEFTGRLMLGRRYSEGLHQAIEAKEHVKVQQETKTFATITIQNYFRMYNKIAGMTGTAVTEAEELNKIYKLEVVVIPTNKTTKRDDLGDFIYKDEGAKFKALAREVEEVHQTGQPILIGTVSIEKNEHLSEMLTRRGIKHNILNANPKKHQSEANIIAEAGALNAVTLATNMAGRGVDIILGGNPAAYDPFERILYHILGKEDIDAARQLLGERVGDKEYPPDIEDTVKALQHTESELRQRRQGLIAGSMPIESDDVKQLQIEQRQIYHKLVNEFSSWKQATADKLKRLAVEATKNGQDEKVAGINATVDTLLKPVDYDKQIENELKKHESALRDWQTNHDRVVELGGLHVMGSERHEARRIDNQLRGRAGRQGDPGTTRFYVALDDDIMRRFGGERIQGIMNWAGMDENTPIENKLISRSIENAQTRVEGYHFDTRKHLVEYDDVINKQREVIYRERRKVLAGADLRSNILAMVQQEIEEAVDEHPQPAPGDDMDYAPLIGHLGGIFPVPKDVTPASLAALSRSDIKEMFIQLSQHLYEQKEKDVTPQVMRVLERLVMLRVIDSLWVEHLTAVDYLRQGIGMAAVAQQDPLVAYKRQASGMFQELLDTIRHEVTEMIYKVNLVKQPMAASSGRPSTPARTMPVPVAASPMAKVVGAPSGSTRGNPGGSQYSARPGQKVGRNELCPCGSGKKYKKCHGVNEP